MEGDDGTQIQIAEQRRIIAMAEQKKNKLLELVTTGSITNANFNNMNPVRTMRFERHNRISQGHKITVKYAFSLTV